MRETTTSLRLLVRTAFDLSPRHALASFLEMGGLVLQRLTPVWVALVVGGAASARPALAWAGALGLALSLGVASLFIVIGVNSRLRMLDLVGHHFDQRLAELAGSTPTLDPLQDSALRETMQIIKERLGALGGSFNSLVGAVNGSVPPLVSLTVAISIDWRLALLALGSVPSILHARWSLAWEEQAEDESASAGLSSQEWCDAVTGPSHDELRSYAALGWAKDRAVADTKDWRRPVARAESRSAWLGLACDAIYIASAVAALTWIVSSPVDVASLAAVLVAILLVATDMREGFEGLRGSVEMLGQALRTLSRYRAALARLAPEVEDDSGHFTGGVRLDDVTFTYDGADRPAVRDVSVDLPPGAVVALVGENGSGKSTLVALLLGLRLPDRGTITAGGVELTPARVRAWRLRCSAVFQDFVRFGLTAAEGVGIGELVRGSDAADDRPLTGTRVTSALERGGAIDVVETLPDGAATLLGPEVGGRDLSGGQWQRIATARGLVRDVPDLLVLDEPTGALDAHAEAALLHRLRSRAGDLQGTRAVTVIVTHRLATARHADLVLVMDGGRLVESGAHTDLIARGGHYAELYDLHAGEYLRT